MTGSNSTESTFQQPPDLPAALNEVYGTRDLLALGRDAADASADAEQLEEVFKAAIVKLNTVVGYLDRAGNLPTDEQPSDVLRAAGPFYDQLSHCVTEARALADVLQLSNDGNEPERESIITTAAMLFNRMHKAREHMEALWVAIGGKPS